MHTLTVGPYIAVLETQTRLGLLVLPPNLDPNYLLNNRSGQAARTAARRWFGRSTAEADYRTIQQQLCTIGWKLPNDDYETASCRTIGDTDCCHRTMVSLNALDVAENPNIQTWIDISMRLQSLATWTCCGAKRFHQAIREPTWSHAPGPH